MPITIDTSVLVNAYTPTNSLHKPAQHIVLQMFKGEHHVVLPYSVLTETICKLSNIFTGKGKDPDLAVEFGDALFVNENITWVEISRSFAYEAAMFGRLHRSRGMD